MVPLKFSSKCDRNKRYNDFLIQIIIGPKAIALKYSSFIIPWRIQYVNNGKTNVFIVAELNKQTATGLSHRVSSSDVLYKILRDYNKYTDVRFSFLDAIVATGDDRDLVYCTLLSE